MKRLFLLGLALGFGLALATAPGSAQAARPTGETVLLLKLNGQPYYGGAAAPGADAGITADIDAGLGDVVKVQCDMVSLQSVHTPVTVANGEQVPAFEARFYVLENTSRAIYVRNVDAGTGRCPWWIMR